METNVSTLLREFPKVRQAALRGETVIVKTREGNLRITADYSELPGGFLGAMKDQISYHDDLDQPTLEEDAWLSPR